jgi:hypothetical protein
MSFMAGRHPYMGEGLVIILTVLGFVVVVTLVRHLIF